MKGYRTIAFNVGAAVLGALMSTDWLSLTDTRTAGLVVGGLASPTPCCASSPTARFPGSGRRSDRPPPVRS